MKNKSTIATILGVASLSLLKKYGSFIRWGRAGSGILFVCPEDNSVLLFERSWDVMEPKTWGIVGGRIDDPENETPWDSAMKESFEETGGNLPIGEILGEIVYKEENFVYTNFIYGITLSQKEQWNIQLNWENDDYKWVPFEALVLGEIPFRLHFGVENLIDNHDEDIRAMMKSFGQSRTLGSANENEIKVIRVEKRKSKYGDRHHMRDMSRGRMFTPKVVGARITLEGNNPQELKTYGHVGQILRAEERKLGLFGKMITFVNVHQSRKSPNLWNSVWEIR